MYTYVHVCTCRFTVYQVSCIACLSGDLVAQLIEHLPRTQCVALLWYTWAVLISTLHCCAVCAHSKLDSNSVSGRLVDTTAPGPLQSIHIYTCSYLNRGFGVNYYVPCYMYYFAQRGFLLCSWGILITVQAVDWSTEVVCILLYRLYTTREYNHTPSNLGPDY